MSSLLIFGSGHRRRWLPIIQDLFQQNAKLFLRFSVHFHGNVFTINSFFQSCGYCWCVNSKSGRPIPGTSLHNARPNCEAPTGGKEPFQIYRSTLLYPIHLVSDFGTEFILEPKMAFVNEIITIKKAIFGSKMNSVPKSLTR